MAHVSVIYLDMDGVLVDLVRHTYSAAGLPTDLLDAAHAETTAWDSMPQVLSKYTGRQWRTADVEHLWTHKGEDFWATVPWTAHGRDLYRKCSMLAPVVLMSTPTQTPSCAAGKVRWIQRQMPFEVRREYALTPCKAKMAHPGALLIDDGEHNVGAFRAAGGQAVLWPGPWNRAIGTPAMAALGQVYRACGCSLGT